MEAWSPALADLISSWDFDASTGQWLNHLAGDLASVSGPAPVLSPGQAFYLQSAAAASLEIPDPALRIRYYHPDHLGSSSAITDADGALVEETAFYPFGTRRNEYEPRQIQEPYQFTQKERDKESRLHYFEARYLAGLLSRFAPTDAKFANPDALSTAELISFLATPQQANSYAYVRNNPLRLVDPSGEDGAKVNSQHDPLQATASGTLTLTDNGGKPIKITVLAYSFPRQARIGATEREGQGGASSELVITTSADQSSSELLRRAYGNGNPMEGALTLSTTSKGHSEVYLTVKLSDVMISSISYSGTAHEAEPVETITLNAAKSEYTYGSSKNGAQSEGQTALNFMNSMDEWDLIWGPSESLLESAWRAEVGRPPLKSSETRSGDSQPRGSLMAANQKWVNGLPY